MNIPVRKSGSSMRDNRDRVNDLLSLATVERDIHWYIVVALRAIPLHAGILRFIRGIEKREDLSWPYSLAIVNFNRKRVAPRLLPVAYHFK